MKTWTSLLYIVKKWMWYNRYSGIKISNWTFLIIKTEFIGLLTNGFPPFSNVDLFMVCSTQSNGFSDSKKKMTNNYSRFFLCQYFRENSGTLKEKKTQIRLRHRMISATKTCIPLCFYKNTSSNLSMSENRKSLTGVTIVLHHFNHTFWASTISVLYVRTRVHLKQRA